MTRHVFFDIAIFALSAICILFFHSHANAADPEATIHSVKQLPGTKTVEIVYSATDEDGDDLDVTINIESNGTSIASLSGSKGEDITKRWNAGTDWNGNAAELTFTVVADDDVNTPTNGLIAYWSFNNNANDLVGENHGNVSGAAHTSNGKIASAYYFDGDDYIDCGDSGDFDGLTAISVGCWIKTSDNESRFVSKWHYLHNMVFSLDTSPVLTVKINDAAEVINGSTALADDQWHYITWTWSSADGHTLYVDGIEDGAWDTNESSLTSSDEDLYFGYKGHRWNFWKGTIDEMAIWNRKLNATEVYQVFQNDTGIIIE